MSIRNYAAFRGILLACGLLGVVAGRHPLAAQDEAAQAPEINPRVLVFMQPVDLTDTDSELVKKLKERHNTAVDLLKAHVEEYKTGVREVSAVLEAARLVAQSKLDLAADDPARLAVYQQLLEVAKLIEDRMGALFEAGIGPVSDYRRAQVARMSVEIEILKLKQASPTSAGSAPAQP